MTGTQSKSFACPGRQQLSRYVSRILLLLSRVCIPVLIRLMRGALILGTSLASPCGVRAAQENAATKPAAIAAVPPTGAELYQQRCAICHGSDLKGTGPVPPPYRTPPDLSTLTRRHGVSASEERNHSGRFWPGPVIQNPAGKDAVEILY
jgi:cytochrome c553